MSVPLSERKQSRQEYVTILQFVEQFFIDENMDEEHRIPKLSEHLCDKAIEAYDNATKLLRMCKDKKNNFTRCKART